MCPRKLPPHLAVFLSEVLPFNSYLAYSHTTPVCVGPRQVGPLGQSSHTDRRPIRLRFDGCVDPRRKLFRQYDPDDDTGKTRRITFLRASKQQGSRR